MNVQKRVLIDLVSEMTRTRNKRLLEQSILPLLSELIQCESISFVRVNLMRGECKLMGTWYEGRGLLDVIDPYFTSCHSHNPYIVEKTDELDLVATTGVHLYIESKRVIFFPAVISEWAVDVFCVQGLQGYKGEESADAVASVCAIYSDFIQVLEDSERDDLTGLLNRKTFDANLEALIQHGSLSRSGDAKGKRQSNVVEASERTSHWLGVLDIDHFKQINDKFGHIYGDEVLLLFSELLRNVFRDNDLLFRFGGEEFVVFLLNIDATSANQAFERFRSELESYRFPQVGQVTVSIGMTRMQEKIHKTTLLDQADKALYFAKEHGRNQVCNYVALLQEGHFEDNEIKGEVDLF